MESSNLVAQLLRNLDYLGLVTSSILLEITELTTQCVDLLASNSKSWRKHLKCWLDDLTKRYRKNKACYESQHTLTLMGKENSLQTAYILENEVVDFKQFQFVSELGHLGQLCKTTLKKIREKTNASIRSSLQVNCLVKTTENWDHRSPQCGKGNKDSLTWFLFRSINLLQREPTSPQGLPTVCNKTPVHP